MWNIAVFWLFLCAFTSQGYGDEMQNILSPIPHNDQKVICELFQYLMLTDHFAYTLFSNKAVSLSGNFILTPIETTIQNAKFGSCFWNKWRVWKKYEKYFPHPKYLFIEEFSYTNQNIKHVFFINKKAFLDNVDRHIIVFQKILGNKISAKKLLSQIEATSQFLSLINNNDMLLGILLGYGSHNSQLFYRRSQIYQFIGSKKLPRLPIKLALPAENFSSLSEEFDHLNVILQPFSEICYSPLLMGTMHFVVDPSNITTRVLRKKYQKLQSKISEIYAGGDFLNITLSSLTSE